MRALAAQLRIVIGTVALLMLVVAECSGPVQAQSSVDPTKSAVSEEQLLQQFKTIRGLGTIPDTKSYTLEQPAGRDWRHFHEVTLPWVGAGAILGILAAIVVFYLSRGMVRL